MLASFRSRLVLSNLLITLLGLLIVVLVFTQLLADRSRQIKESDRQAQARDVAVQVANLYKLPAAESKQQLQQLVYTASRVLGARIVIFSAFGEARIDSARRTPFYTGSWRPLDRNALRAEKNVLLQLHSSNVYGFQAPIQGTNGRNGGAVLLIVRVTEVQPDVSSLVRIILGAVGFVLVVWLLLGIYFTTSIFRPLLQITGATEQMARGDYSARVPARGAGEIARLASSFNTMAEQVQRTNQVLRDFLANVSHDLRTPLTMISGFSQAILDGTAGPKDAEFSATVIHEEASKMQRLVDDLFQLTRLESGLLKLDRRPVQLRPFVEHLLERVERASGTGQLPALRNDVPATLPAADVDPMQLERAIRNLLDNAIQYTPADGSITVGAGAGVRGWIELSVSDNGTGIPQEVLPRIFERFYRADKSRQRTQGHSGLGLAIVREIVEAHGGQVSAESEPGRGTTFRLTVPVASGQPLAAEPEPERAAAP